MKSIKKIIENFCLGSKKKENDEQKQNLVNAQEWFDKNYSNKNEIKKIETNFVPEGASFAEDVCGGSLIIDDYPNLENLGVHTYRLKSPLDSLTIANCPRLNEIFIPSENFSLKLKNLPNLTRLIWCNSNLTSVDFLNDLPNPEKLEYLNIAGSNIQPTDITVFSCFINLKRLLIGSENKEKISQGIYNRFYGSLKSLRNLTKLRELCIAGTDVNEGLEYLPKNFASNSRGGLGGKKYKQIEEEWGVINMISGSFQNYPDCRPTAPNAKIAQIQNELRPFNYDLEAWQLAHPEKMLIARPELFTNPDSKDKWLQALENKIKELRRELEGEREIQADATKTMDRWYLQINLELVEENRKKDQKIKELEQQLENKIVTPPKK